VEQNCDEDSQHAVPTMVTDIETREHFNVAHLFNANCKQLMVDTDVTLYILSANAHIDRNPASCSSLPVLKSSYCAIILVLDS
jgi:hypothetical protein